MTLRSYPGPRACVTGLADPEVGTLSDLQPWQEGEARGARHRHPLLRPQSSFSNTMQSSTAVKIGDIS